MFDCTCNTQNSLLLNQHDGDDALQDHQCASIPMRPITTNHPSSLHTCPTNFLDFCTMWQQVSKTDVCLPIQPKYYHSLLTSNLQDGGSKLLWNFRNKPTATWHKYSHIIHINNKSMLQHNISCHCGHLSVAAGSQVSNYSAIQIWGCLRGRMR